MEWVFLRKKKNHIININILVTDVIDLTEIHWQRAQTIVLLTVAET